MNGKRFFFVIDLIKDLPGNLISDVWNKLNQ
jgi:hypothetical protein